MFSDQYEREKTPNMAASKKWSKSQPYGTDNEDERRAAVQNLSKRSYEHVYKREEETGESEKDEVTEINITIDVPNETV